MRTYHITALRMPVYFNREGDHDHNGMIYALTANADLLRYVRALAEGRDPAEWFAAAQARAAHLGLPLPQTPQQARQPFPLVRPLVLRAGRGETVQVVLRNEISGRPVGIHLVADGYDVNTSDGSDVGDNPASLAPDGGTWTYTWACRHEGVFPFHDGGDYSGGEDGTNVHGLFGALIVEPPDVAWRDPVTGLSSLAEPLDGLYLDVIPAGSVPDPDTIHPPTTTLDTHPWPAPDPYPDFDAEAYREFVIFFHDEPEFIPPHVPAPVSPCGHGSHGGGHGGMGHGGHGDLPPLMPVSLRAEPMINREHTLWRLLNAGHVLERPVLNEEQHHSSWMFGDPVTPILKAYIGDPVRIRFVHAGVKETHVFHLHLYEWHAVSQDRTAPRIDAISVSPQTGHTIEPVWGAGNRHQVAGDVIWHCHLYPHFHEGMWGMFRTFETYQSGVPGVALASSDPVYAGRTLGRYPDGTPIERLLPLPGRLAPPAPTAHQPGYPLYIPGTIRQKSPIPPWPAAAGLMPPDYNYRPVPTHLETLAFNAQPVPGELFTRNPMARQQAAVYADEAADPALKPRISWNAFREVSHDLVVTRQEIVYNHHGWHDPDGHLYYLAAEGDPASRPGPKEPLFFRARHGQILNVTLHNLTPREIAETAFDPPFPPCPALPWEGECGPHVHMVKFDPICADGASVGWNYISGAVIGKKMVYRWWADEEFGVIFFHDHLFANYRQKHGLFGGLLVEPAGAGCYSPFADRPITSGLQARIKRHPDDTGRGPAWFREFCLGLADFIPMFDRHGQPLNPPEHPGGHGDQGVMALNYRNEPIRERPGDPAFWFSSLFHGRDPSTTLFAAYENDPVWLRVLQGSHEEQHSLQIHGMRWRRFRGNAESTVRAQQTLGISEAFTFINEELTRPGDYLYKLSGADDLWLGCWGIIRAFASLAARMETGGLLKLADGADIPEVPSEAVPPPPELPAGASVRQFHVIAEPRRLVYRDPDLVDPFGLVYRLTSVTLPDGEVQPVSHPPDEPLVLRCLEGEYVQVTLENRLPALLLPEPFAPEVPLEERNPNTFRPERPVSGHVSMHADLVLYDVRRSDGANVGLNPQQTVPPRSGAPYHQRTYTWHAQRPPRTATSPAEPLGAVLLQDMADFRNHRHHGLIGALVIEDARVTPRRVDPGQATAAAGNPAAWYGTRATLVYDEELADERREEEIVLLMQDGLRLFLRGNVYMPIADEPPAAFDDQPDHEDRGQKGFNYRSEPVGPPQWLNQPADSIATPVWRVPVGQPVRFHLVGALDKPRNQSFTIHGVAWEEWRFLTAGSGPMVASESAISCGTSRTFLFTPRHVGDHAYRSGVLKWSVAQGMWGLLRVV
jgi:hypothetical protein